MISQRSLGRALGALWAGALVALGIACASGDEPNGAAAAAGRCAAAYGAQCGAACADDAGCAGGLFCSFGACTAECTAAEGCAAGLSCSARGRCVAAGPAPTGAPTVAPTAPAPPGPAPTTCASDIEVAVTKVTPDVMFVIDQSGSMLCPLEATERCEVPPFPALPLPETRWGALRNALLAETGPIFRLQGQVNFGLSLYSGYEAPAACPDLANSTGIAPANYAAIKQMYEGAKTKNGTPTGESVKRVVGELTAAGAANGNPKYVILATDGNPGTCACLTSDCTSQAGPRALSEAAVAEGFAKGVTTFVIGVGRDQVDETHLQNLALAGQGLPAATAEKKFYEVGSEQELIATFDQLTAGVRSCVVSLDATVDPSDASKGKVTLDGQPVPFGDPDGWRLLTTNDKIEFVGLACAKVREPATQIAVAFQCGSNVTPKPR